MHRSIIPKTPSTDSPSGYLIRLAAVFLLPPLLVWMDVFSYMLSGHPLFGEEFRMWHNQLPDLAQIGIRFGCPVLAMILAVIAYVQGHRTRLVRAIVLCGAVFVVLAMFTVYGLS